MERKGEERGTFISARDSYRPDVALAKSGQNAADRVNS